jgi:RNA polymerase sigma-70 factor, ECF subfamily
MTATIVSFAPAAARAEDARIGAKPGSIGAEDLARDEALVAAARAGDHAAYTALYQRHARRAYARLTQLVGPTSEREDLLQQIFLELYRALPRFRSESSLATFLHGIVVHVAFDHLRRRRRQPQDFSAIELDEMIDADPTPEDRARRRDELTQVMGLLEKMKPAKRIAFSLVAISGLSLDEAAAILEVSSDVVKQRVLRARRELLTILERAERSEKGAR